MWSSALIRTGTEFEDVVSSRYEDQYRFMTSCHEHFIDFFGTAFLVTVTARATRTTYPITLFSTFSILQVEWNNNIQLV